MSLTNSKFNSNHGTGSVLKSSWCPRRTSLLPMAPRHIRLVGARHRQHVRLRCLTKNIFLPFFRNNASHKHLDIRVSTGYYLYHANLPADTQIILLDLNANSVEAAKRRFSRSDTSCVLHDIFEPLPSELGEFDSMSMFYFLHSLPGSLEDECSISEHLKRNLTKMAACTRQNSRKRCKAQSIRQDNPKVWQQG